MNKLANTSDILTFQFRGEWYQVNRHGWIKANGLPAFSNSWIFLGGTKHHMRNSIDFDLQDAFANPSLLNGCLGWDRDHGTTRQWGGCFNGKLPRIQHAHLVPFQP